uniref:Uncharacterized protein n=1 Tax=Tanacetum cinerariifolium TaxID=118510 RepID=A0A6L2L120_TANCI|nr:hypothetical protein [Tanacetum cinerariifolium]
MDDSTGVSTSLCEISLEGKKSWESDIGDCDNTGDGSKTAGRAIITWGGEIALYACMASYTDHHVKEVLLKLNLPRYRYNIHTVKRSLRNRRIRRWRYNLTPAESKFKTPMLDHQDKNMMKALVHESKSSTISDVQPLPRRKHFCQIYQMIKHMLRGRLLASFQDLEHEGGDTRSQGGMRFKDKDIKI